MHYDRLPFFTNLLESGHTFHDNEILLKFQYRVLNTILLVIIFFASSFALSSALGLNPLGHVHTLTNVFYAVSSALIMVWMRGPKTRYLQCAYLMYFVSMIDFISALIYVPHDEFRIIWFYLVVFAAYITGGVRAGNVLAFLSLAVILTVNAFVELHLSVTAIISSTVGLLIASILFRSYTKKIVDFEETLIAQKRTLQHFNSNLEAVVRQKTAELHELNASLEAKVEEKVAKLAEQEELMIAQSRLAAMGEMLSMIAHQWRQPLSTTTLMITNEQLKGIMEGREPDARDDMLQKISDTMIYLSDTIDDFQTYFKPEKQCETIVACAMLERAAQFSETRLKLSRIAIEIECHDEGEIETYVSELLQVLINIINNAIDAMVTNRQENRRLRITANGDDAWLTIAIEDNGGGIDPEVLPKIFEPYFSTKSKNGTGLGLYMSKMIVEQHISGQIGVANTQEGARFEVQVPRKSAEKR